MTECQMTNNLLPFPWCLDMFCLGNFYCTLWTWLTVWQTLARVLCHGKPHTTRTCMIIRLCQIPKNQIINCTERHLLTPKL